MFVGAKEYREKFFSEGSRPDIATIRGWIRRGELPGKKMGGKYYVLLEDAANLPEKDQEPDFSMYATK